MARRLGTGTDLPRGRVTRRGMRPTPGIVRLLRLVMCCVAFAAATPAAASAVVLHVTSSADTGTGTLRAAVAAANSGDTIVIDPGVNPSLTSGDIPIESNSPFSLTIVGQGAHGTTINANADSQIFFLGNTNGSLTTAFVTLTLSHMTLADGFGGGDFSDGGALDSEDANLTLDDVTLTGNAAQSDGGAIFQCGGTMSLTDVTVVANTARFEGGGIEPGCSNATTNAQIINSTVADNTVTAGSGGGLALVGKLQSATLVDDTIFGNSASGGTGSAGGNLDLSAATVNLQNTIIAGGVSPSGANCSGAAITSLGDNLEDTNPSQCGLSTAKGDLIGVSPAFRTSIPADNGGETDTLALSPGSPAIGRVPAARCGAATDQRGLPRPGQSSSGCDIGAYELFAPPVVVVCSPSSTLVGTPTTCSASATGVAGVDLAPPTGRVTFSSDSAGAFSAGAGCALAAGAGPTAGCTVSYTPTAFGTGTHRILAVYGGDATYSVGSSSTTVGVTRRTTSVSATCSPGTVPVGGSTTCTATATDAMAGGGATAPTGDIGFSSSAAGRFSGNGTCALAASAATASCSAAFTPSSSDAGTYVITARYAGDSTHAAVSGTTSVASSPVSGVTGNVTVLEGTVIITEPAAHIAHTSGAPAPIVSSVPLKGQTVSVPMGATIDARKGEVALATAADYDSAQNAHHQIQTGVFAASMFTVKQQTAREALNRQRRQRKHKRRPTGIPATRLVLANPPGAATAAHCRRAGSPGNGIVRSLHGQAKGLYETVGAASITTVTNGLWTVEDRCDGTVTEVGRGRAVVTPTHGRHPKSVVVNHGQAVIVKSRFLPLKGISKGRAVHPAGLTEPGVG
jgi:hypothetical protein